MRLRAFRFSFFFSSRRRHTRYIGDWSSDVCSSDLAAAATAPGVIHHVEGDRFPIGELDGKETPRSEERRVGKECRARWGGAAAKKKVAQKREGRQSEGSARGPRWGGGS